MHKYAQTQPHVNFLDVSRPMLYKDETLKKSLFISDGLHMTAEGYT